MQNENNDGFDPIIVTLEDVAAAEQDEDLMDDPSLVAQIAKVKQFLIDNPNAVVQQRIYNDSAWDYVDSNGKVISSYNFFS